MKTILLLDIITAMILFLTLTSLSIFKILPLKMYLWFLTGLFLGTIWECCHSLIPNFIFMKKNLDVNHMFLYTVAHSIWDGFILFLSAFIVIGLLKISISSAASLILILIFGLSFEVIIELLFNGTVWTYNENLKYNPVLFRISTVGFTLWPFLEWILAPILFWTFINLM